jgi:chromosome segregation ATPase
MKKKLMVLTLSILLLLTTGLGIVVLANTENGWLDWTGNDELDNALLVIDELVADINELDVNLATITIERDTLLNDIDMLEDQALDLQAEIDALDLQVAGLQADIVSLNADNTTLTSELNEIKLAIDTWVGNESIVLTGTETYVDKLVLLEDLNSNNAGGKAELQAELNALNSELSAMLLGYSIDIIDPTPLTGLTASDKLSLIDDYIVSLQTEIVDLELEVTDLETQVTTLTAANTVLQTQIDALTLEVADLETQVTTLTAANTVLQAQLTAAQSQIDDLTAERNWLFDQLTQANSDAQAFKTGVCEAIDDLPPGLRGDYTTWCPIS